MVAWRLKEEKKDLAKEALNKSIYNGQTGLALAAQLAQATVSAFFSGQKIFRANFEILCELLKLDPQEVRDDPRKGTDPPYVRRSNETFWYQKILEPHILIRIQAPAQFGKTSLICRILDRSRQEGHLAILINLTEIDRHSLANPQTFLRQFFVQIEDEIEENFLDALMSDIEYERLVNKLGLTKACIKYLEYLQKNISKPLTIGINKIDRLLEYPDTALTFFALLRLMNEKSMLGGKWGNFRMVFAHSTPAIEPFIGMSPHQSPFNLGYSIELPEFTASQIADFASQYQLTLDPTEITKLMQAIGGIPILIKITFDRIQRDGISILELDNLYQDHLRMLAGWLQNNNLQSAMERVVQNPEGSDSLSFKEQCLLHRQGLVVFANNGVKSRCKLYHQYFSRSNIDV
jgi:AAA-like domain